MFYTSRILDLLRDKLGSDYRTSLTFGKGPSYAGSLRSRGGILPDELGLKAAEILGMPEEFIILSLAAERAMSTDSFDQMAALADKYQPPKKPKKPASMAMTG